MKKLDKEKLITTLKITIKVIFAILFVAFILMVCLQRFSNNKVSFFNYRMFTVVSGSMEPKYKIGDVLISKDVDASKVKVGDTISYLGNKGDFANKVITHEVISKEKDIDGNYVFQTKGKANPINDLYPVTEDQLYGVVVYRSFILSFVYKIVGTKLGLFVFIVLPLLYIIGSEIISAMLEKEEKRRQKL